MNKIDFSADYYEGLCSRMSELLTQEKELKAEKDALREEIISYAGGDRMENGIKVAFVPGRETVDYKGLVEDLELSSGLIDSYRKVGVGHWRITKY